MRSRSSRLFIVLLHLVGVSTNLPRPGYSYWWNVGIVGVHPMAILFESLDLKHAGGLDGFLAQMRALGYDPDIDILAEPYWLQDDTDGKCLGPDGFSECGDATLWHVRRRKYPSGRKGASEQVEDGHNSNKRKRGLFSLVSFFTGGVEEPAHADEWGYALQLLDAEILSSISAHTSENALVEIGQKRKRKGRKGELEELFGKDCLIPNDANRSRQGEARQSSGSNEDELAERPWESLRTGPCSSEEAWAWSVNGEGILIHDKKAFETASHRKRHKERNRQVLMGGSIAWQLQRGRNINDPALSDNIADCIWRSDSNEAILAPCIDEMEVNSTSQNINSTAKPLSGSEKPVGFSLVRYQGAASSVRKLPSLMERPTITVDVGSIVPPLGDSKARMDSSNSMVKEHSRPDPIKKEEKMKYTSSLHSNTHRDHFDHPPTTKRTSQSHASNPVLHSDIKPSSQLLHTHASKISHASLASNRDPNNRRLLHKPGSFSGEQGHHLLHHPPTSSLPPGSPLGHHDDTPHMPRKIPVHPYIESSKDGLWEDPATGLRYLTDLCEYLGHERKEVGRHTLVGVGQFVKTMLKIKVYGVALYLSKRDVLADPNFVPHARSSADELRQGDGLYNYLMNAPSSSGGRIDRTLLLKLNMQLSTETMRTSLQADWKLLTDEHKEMLVSTSFKPRDADEKMLQKIKSEENSSNCSCGQNAPAEYNADPSCCARGTDLVFTWRKNGDLEVIAFLEFNFVV
mmetsp:Transcript_8848/g.11761  ORF Transcript_8848/g.11761 Transcript_8848/m.11761 type:complete len:743 (+) Transcript_8848:533-2761(+)